jgi:hypothetical protein
MGVSTPFLDPWDILYELGPIMEEINKLYPDVPTVKDEVVTYMHDDENSAAIDWKRRIENCSWKLPTVHEAILRRQKIS